MLPLATTLLAAAVMVRSSHVLTTESRALTAAAMRLAPLTANIRDSAARARGYGSSVADATQRYTSGHG